MKIKFPTMLRKMWSGGEVQVWIDEHVQPLLDWSEFSSPPPADEDVLLYCGKNVPVYCGRLREGNYGEPQQGAVAWRCSSSGRFATPILWKRIMLPGGRP